MSIYTKEFWVKATERAVKTLAQFVLVMFGGESFNIFTLDWMQFAGVALAGVVVSYATSIVSANFGDKGTPSLVKSKTK